MTRILTAWATAATEGIPLPYSLRTDDCIALLLFGCFFLSSFILSRNRNLLFQLMKDFLLHRARTSIFITSTASDMRYMFLLTLQTCVLGGLCIFNHFNHTQPELIHHLHPGILLSIYIATCILYLMAKWLIYSFLGWIFFDESTTSFWLESYSTLLYHLGFALFPFCLSIVYFDLSPHSAVIIGLILVILAKILMFYKWIRLFCHDLHGSLLLILYFCALEIIPCLVLYQGMVQLNDYLIIKF